jgi:glycosyltransferase involved in cell wall biosynthesis
MDSIYKYRVLYVTRSSSLYGDNKALLNILDGVKEKGIRPLVVMASKGKMSSELEMRNIEYEVINNCFYIYPSLNSTRDILVFIPRLLRTIWCNFLAKNKLAIVVKQFNPNIIHTNVGPIHIGFIIAKKFGIPHIWHIREYQDLDFDMHPLFSVVGFVKKLQTKPNNSITITKGIFNHFSLTTYNTRVIYDGVMNADNVQFELVKEKYFLFVGRLEEAKGIKNLIVAFVEFCKFNLEFELLIAGDGELNYKKELQQIIDDAKIASRVQFLGFRFDVSNLMAKATALVVPSRHEGFGFITVEAMFNGCLVIGNDSAGTKEILEKENLGILYSGHNKLVSALKDIISKGIESYYPLMKKAQQRAITLYSKEQNVEAVYKYYEDILRKKTE